MTNWPIRRRRSFRISLEAVLAASTACALLWYVAHASTARRALPWSAKDVREFYWDGACAEHLDYFLRAKISREEFDKYATRLGFSGSRQSGRDQQGIAKLRIVDAPWWNSPKTPLPSLVKHSKDARFIERLQYYERYVYYSASTRK